MIINRFYAFTFLIIVFLAGCKSARVVQPEPPVTVEIPVQESQDELRGLYVSIHRNHKMS
jgi:hypothetical protein